MYINPCRLDLQKSILLVSHQVRLSIRSFGVDKGRNFNEKFYQISPFRFRCMRSFVRMACYVAYQELNGDGLVSSYLKPSSRSQISIDSSRSNAGHDKPTSSSDINRSSAKVSTSRNSDACKLAGKYLILDDHGEEQGKRSVDVRLSRKLSRDNLRQIAQAIHSYGPNSIKRTFIVYYLQGMPVGGGGWATSHFNPKLEIKILGPSLAQSNRVASDTESQAKVEIDESDPQMRTQETSKSTRETIPELLGVWVDNSAYAGGIIRLYKVGNKFFLYTKFTDGSSGNTEVIERSSPYGRRFDPQVKSQTGDHWVITQNGNLEIRDDQGLITTARKRP